MRDVRKLGGIAALVEAVFFLVVPVFFVLILPRLGLALSDQADTTKLLMFSTKNAALMLFDAAAVIAAAAMVALALVVQERLREAAPLVMRGALIAVSIGAALLVASGIGDTYDLAGLTQLYGANAANHAMAETAYAAVGTLAVGLLWAGGLSYGVWVTMASWVALRSGAFRPALNYIGLAWGVLAILSVFAFVSPTLMMLGLLAPIVGVIWAGWLAMLLLQVSAPARVGARVARGTQGTQGQPPAPAS
jgi:hypothetical protein